MKGLSIVDVMQAIEMRRSVKAFDPAHVMEDGEFRELMRLAQLSPTAFNIQHYRFLVVDDTELRRQIRAASFDQAQVTDASLLVVLCADRHAWRKNPARYWDHVPAENQEALVGMIGQYYEGREQEQRDECMRTCGIAAQTLMLAAQGMGYDSCPMDGFDFDAVSRLINLPDDHVLTMFVAIGKPLAPAHPRGGQIPDNEAVIRNRFATD